MSEPREVPLLFSAPMVQAVLAGRKTQTRRLVKFPPHDMAEFDFQFLYDKPDGLLQASFKRRDPGPTVQFVSGRTPYAPGDIIWVRENFRAEERADGLDGIRYMADDAWVAIDNTVEASTRWLKVFTYGKGKIQDRIGPQVPSIHMPRWASRITLRCTDVRVERLNDCSEADAKAEGVHELPCPGPHRGAGATYWTADPALEISRVDPVDAYAALWDHINGDGAWAKNPLVWAYSFERIS